MTSYCPNPAEWFAEMARVFITNPALLAALKPRTHGLLAARWKPVGHPTDWTIALGPDAPRHIVDNLANKIARAKK